MEIQLPMEQPKTTVWDNYVPIVTEGRVTDVYLTDGIEAPSEYNQLCRILGSAYNGDVVNLHINSGGGYVDSGFMIIDAIKRSNATVVAKLSGTVASVATIISLSCDSVEIAPYVQFMIHNYSGGASGKGHEMKAQMDFTDSQLNLAFSEIYGGFLTEHEMELVIAGKDLWMGKAEVEARLMARATQDFSALDLIESDRKGK
jgi:ATP-dependent protease ClpP protease subunit